MNWCFTIINSRLAEIFFEKKGKSVKFLGHCYVKKEEYKTRQEQRWIAEDTKRVRLRYQKRKYIAVTAK